jgi:adenine-specific DNA-methyltransferase
VVFETLEGLLAAAGDPSAKFPRDARGAPLLYEGLPNLGDWVGRKIGIGAPQLKIYRSKLGSEWQPVSSWITANAEAQSGAKTPGLHAGYNQEGTKMVTGLLGAGAFSYPKPVSLISGLISQCTSGGDIVLDFFAGSGTTGQAVLELNATDGELRNFILVSSSEATEDEPDKNVCRDVCSERMRRLIAGTSEREPLVGDFAYLKIEKTSFQDLSYDLQPSDIWLAVLACHGLPLTPYVADSAVQVATDGEICIAYCDKPTVGALAHLEKLAEEGFLIVYSWSPGRIEPTLAGHNTAEVRAVPDELIRRFQS